MTTTDAPATSFFDDQATLDISDSVSMKKSTRLARFNRKQAGSVGEALRMHREIQAGTFLVESVALFRSIQKAHGSAYTVLDRFLFR